MARHDRAEVLAAFEKAEAAVAPVYDIREVMADPQYRALGTITEVPDDELGTVRMQNVLFRLSETPGAIRWAGRPHGADTDEVLAGIGLTGPEIEGCARRGCCDGGAPGPRRRGPAGAGAGRATVLTARQRPGTAQRRADPTYRVRPARSAAGGGWPPQDFWCCRCRRAWRRPPRGRRPRLRPSRPRARPSRTPRTPRASRVSRGFRTSRAPPPARSRRRRPASARSSRPRHRRWWRQHRRRRRSQRP
ncbi:CoA transferase [Streptomyces lydicus]|nr:CoA transferase [Streptomyces lydicus]